MFAYWVPDNYKVENGELSQNFKAPLSFIYLTNWGISFAFFYFLLVSLNLIFGHTIFKQYRLDKIAFIIQEIAVSYQLPIVILYWVVVANQFSLRGFLAHGGVLLTMIIECMIFKIQFQTSHLQVFHFVNLSYFLLNISWSLLIEPVYYDITWKNPFSFVMGTIAFCLTYLSFYLFKYMTDNYEISDQQITKIQISPS